jgi:hypothetical protein
VALKVAKAAFPPDRTPKRLWTAAEHMRADRFLPEDQEYSHTELQGPNAGYAFPLIEWDAK